MCKKVLSFIFFVHLLKIKINDYEKEHFINCPFGRFIIGNCL